ncbi:hypothetical protein ACLB1Q_10100 [Escherichia coli]
MSDKALGALRLAVADNEHLRDVLRMSEDPKRPERKIPFFVAVYRAYCVNVFVRILFVPMIRWKLSNRWRSNLAV